MGGSIADWALLLTSLVGLVTLFMWMISLGNDKKEVDEDRREFGPDDGNIDGDDNQGDNNEQNNNVNNVNMMNFNMSRKKIHKVEKKRLKNEQKEAFKAYIQMKKEKEEEKLRQWRERYGNTQDDESDDSDDDRSAGVASTGGCGRSFSRKSRDERFQAHSRLLMDQIERELADSDVLVISDISRNLSIDCDTCVLLIQMIDDNSSTPKGLFIENQSKYLKLSERLACGMNELVQRHGTVDSEMVGSFIRDYMKDCGR